MKVAQIICLLLLLILAEAFAQAQNAPLSERMADTAMNSLWRDKTRNEAGTPAKWTYDQGVVLKGLEGVWLSTGDGKYFSYIQQAMDHYLNDDGTIRTYKREDYNLDNVLPARNLLLLYSSHGIVVPLHAVSAVFVEFDTELPGKFIEVIKLRVTHVVSH